MSDTPRCDECFKLFEMYSEGGQGDAARHLARELERENARYIQAFMHTHVAGQNDIDRCAQCGLDLRDPIHARPVMLSQHKDEIMAAEGNKSPATNRVLTEIQSVIKDQINRHVAMTQKHRDWLGQDISQRVAALVDELDREKANLRGLLGRLRGHISNGHLDAEVAAALQSKDTCPVCDGGHGNDSGCSCPK